MTARLDPRHVRVEVGELAVALRSMGGSYWSPRLLRARESPREILEWEECPRPVWYDAHPSAARIREVYGRLPEEMELRPPSARVAELDSRKVCLEYGLRWLPEFPEATTKRIGALAWLWAKFEEPGKSVRRVVTCGVAWAAGGELAVLGRLRRGKLMVYQELARTSDLDEALAAVPSEHFDEAVSIIVAPDSALLRRQEAEFARESLPG